MHIWIINHYAILANEAGGTRHFSLARELVRRGHRVSVFASAFRHVQHSESADALTRRGGAKSAVETIEGVTFIQVPTPAYQGNGLGRIRNMVSFGRRVWRQARDGRFGRPDVVLGSSPHPFAAVAARRLARQFDVPFVLEVRDLWPDSLVKVGGASPLHPLVLTLRRIERSLYRSADAIVSLLPHAAGHIASRGGVSDRIVWIPNGVDFTIAGPMRPVLDNGDRPFVVMYAGTMGKANALDSIIDAAALLRDSASTIRFRFVGEGPERPRLAARATTEQLTNVSFEPPVSKARVFDVLREADALIVTTRNIDLYEHGLSLNKLFDYLAVGRPIVFGADCPGNPVLDANAGFVVPPEDATAMAGAVQCLAAMKPDERRSIGLRGRQYAESHHDMAELAARLEDTLMRAVRGGRT